MSCEVDTTSLSPRKTSSHSNNFSLLRTKIHIFLSLAHIHLSHRRHFVVFSSSFLSTVCPVLSRFRASLRPESLSSFPSSIFEADFFGSKVPGSTPGSILHTALKRVFCITMPLHRVFHPTGFFSAADKKAISERVTALYTGVGLPAFYVVVIFIDVDADSLFVGGEPTSNFVRIVVAHVARHLVDPENRASTMQALENAFAPYIKDRGMNWELHVEEHDRELWRENGLVPPMPQTAAEKTWVKLNKAVPYLNE